MSKPFLGLCVLACAALAWTAPVRAQGTQIYPPVPGPFLVAPMRPAAPVAPAETLRAGPIPGPETIFAPPANAMRLPYWMQPGAAPQMPEPQTDRVVAAPAPPAEPAAPVGGQPGMMGYGQALAPGAFPSYAAQPPWAGQAPGARIAAPQDYGQAPQGYGYGMPPGWAAQPYAPGPGWGGWSQPTAGAGN